MIDYTMADLLADAALVRLPAPRATVPPRVPVPPRVIDLTVPEPRSIEIPAATISLVEGYADSCL